MEPHFKFNSVEPVDFVLDIVRSDLNEHLSVQGVQAILGWYEDHDCDRTVVCMDYNCPTPCGRVFVTYAGSTSIPGFWTKKDYVGPQLDSEEEKPPVFPDPSDRKVVNLKFAVGDYVLVSRHSDADMNDPWAVGFLAEINIDSKGPAYRVVDREGKAIIVNGHWFRHCRAISLGEAEDRIRAAKAKAG